MKTIGADKVHDEVRRLAGGAIVALVPEGNVFVAHRVVCDELVPLAEDPSVFGHEDLGLFLAEAGPGATGRCRADLVRLDDDGFACARGHGFDRRTDGYVDTEGWALYEYEEATR